MNDELQKTIADLASKLGTSIEKLWPILVADQRLDYMMGLAASACFAVLSSISFAFLFSRGEDFDETGKAAGIAISVVVFVVSVFCIFACISPIFYPEAAVIRSLLQQ